MGVTGRLMLDTHALLWTLLDPIQIPATTLRHIQDARTELFVSAASAWEIGTKYRLGKLGEAAAVVHGYADHLVRLRAQEIPINSHHALTAGTLNWAHRDPFDRVIASQCMIESLPLVTADRQLAAFPGLRVIW